MKELNEISYFCRNFMNRDIDIPIRPSDMGLLILLSEGEFVTSLEASKFFEFSKPMVAGIVKRLLNKSYIFKTADMQDRRLQYLHLTSKGKKLVLESKTKYIAYVEKLKSGMGSMRFSEFMKQIELANEVIRGMKSNG